MASRSFCPDAQPAVARAAVRAGSGRPRRSGRGRGSRSSRSAVEVVGGVRDAVPVAEAQARLLAVRAGEPAQEVVEGAVLHHHHDHVLDAGVGRGGQRRGGERRLLGEPPAGPGGEESGGAGGAEQVSTGESHRGTIPARPRARKGAPGNLSGCLPSRQVASTWTVTGITAGYAHRVDRPHDGGDAPDGRLRELLRAQGSLIGVLDLQTVLRRIVEMACELVDAPFGALGVITPDGTALEQFIHVGHGRRDGGRDRAAPRGEGTARGADRGSPADPARGPRHRPPVGRVPGGSPAR